MVLVVLGAAACTSGSAKDPAATGSLSNVQFSSPTSTPSLSVSPSPSGSPGSAQLQAAQDKGCKPADFVKYAGLAGGAVRHYVADPASSGAFLAGAPGRAASLAEAKKAVLYANVQLGRAKAALKGCPATSDRLESVIDQDRKLLGTFEKELAAGKLLGNRPSAVLAMHENVVAQASLLKMTVTDAVPTAAQLAS